MKLTAPYTGVVVEAEGEQAKALIARGFKAEEKPVKKQVQKKTTKE